MPTARAMAGPIEPHGAAGGRRGGERAEHRGRMEAGLVDRLRGDEAAAAQDLDPDRQPLHDVAAGEAALLGQGEQRRHDHGAGMDGPALEGVVEILAMRGRAVDERGLVTGQRLRMADGRRTAAAFRARQRRRDVVGRTGGDAKARHIEEEPMADRLDVVGQGVGVERSGPMTDPLGKRCLARFCFGDAIHGVASLRASDWLSRTSRTSDQMTKTAAVTRNPIAMGSSRKMAWSPPERSSERR